MEPLGGEPPCGPPPTKLVDDLPEWKHSAKLLKTSSGDADRRLDEIIARLDQNSGDVDEIKLKLDELGSKYELFTQKQDDMEQVHRKQLDCVSQRVFETEKQLSEAQQLQEDAIAKANAVFEKHASEVEQERHNLMSVIGQVNRNFDHLSGEIAQHGTVVTDSEERMRQLQLSMEHSVELVSNDSGRLAHDSHKQNECIAALQECVSDLEQALGQEQASVVELFNGLHEAQLSMQRLARQCSEAPTDRSELSLLKDEQSELRDRLHRTETSLRRVLQSIPPSGQPRPVPEAFNAPPRQLSGDVEASLGQMQFPADASSGLRLRLGPSNIAEGRRDRSIGPISDLDVDDAIASERECFAIASEREGAIPSGPPLHSGASDHEAWAAVDVAAPEPAALAQPAFCRTTSTPMLGAVRWDSDQGFAQNRGTGLPRGSPSPQRAHALISARGSF